MNINKINLLDCTLRDGGWINGFHFGKQAMNEIAAASCQAGIEWIELGYFDEKKGYARDRSFYADMESLFHSFEDMTDSLKDSGRLIMIDCGKYQVDRLPERNDRVSTVLDGIRICFHKKDVEKAIEDGRRVLDKGYQLFMQPMVTTRYTDQEFSRLLEKLQKNVTGMSGVYIVDSFGVLSENEVMGRLKLSDHELDPEYMVGLHSHNNRNKSFSIAKAAVALKLHPERCLNIDATYQGMGKGAGNLSIEEFAVYLNENYQSHYQEDALKAVSEKWISPVRQENPWGYSFIYELSARYQVTPSYAKFFSYSAGSVDEVEKLLAGISENKKDSFDRDFAEEYIRKVLG